MTQEAAWRAAEAAARLAHGRLVALLAARSRDIAGAEDALSEALLAALEHWPRSGVPERPEAWLMTAARNRMANAFRHRAVGEAAMPELQRRAEAAADADEAFADERLRLMFVCAHPAIDEAVRAPLMLQTVLGLDAARIADAFLVPAATMGQRLSRAKGKIRDAGIRFEVPGTEALANRLDAVLDAIYVAFGQGWNDPLAADRGADLAAEAIYLGRMVAGMMPREPEPRGLLALMLYAEARRPARHDEAGHFVPLARQDARLWNRAMIIEAEGLLTEAARSARFGRFQCEAAIQSVHVQRPITGRTNHAALASLYGLLAAHAPSIGAGIGQAVALAEGGDAGAGLAALDAIDHERSDAHQPYWVARARVLELAGNHVAAMACLDRSMALSRDAAILRHLGGWRDRLARGAGAQGSRA